MSTIYYCSHTVVEAFKQETCIPGPSRNVCVVETSLIPAIFCEDKQDEGSQTYFFQDTTQSSEENIFKNMKKRLKLGYTKTDTPLGKTQSCQSHFNKTL